ncbi:MAG: hypothetical protein QXN59_03075 [Candidatus Micrarchaeaceae archaeon]
MKICIISTAKPHKGSGLGITEYAYQLEKHLRLLLSEKDVVEDIYGLADSKRNDIAGLIKVNTSFKRKLKAYCC